MKKLLAILVALTIAVSALSLTAFAADIDVFDDASGKSFSDCTNAWDFFGTGNVWEREAANALDISLEDLRSLFESGDYVFTFVYGGTPAGWSDTQGAPSAVINDEFDFFAVCDVTDLGDGKYEASVALSDVLSAWGKPVSDITGFVIQVWAEDFVLYSANFSNGSDDALPAPAEDDNANEDAPAPETTPEPEAAATPAPATTAETSPNTGITLAVVPALMALAAVAVSKKR